MSGGDVTKGFLKRLSWLPERASEDNGTLIAGQEYYDIEFTGGAISNVTLTDVTVNGTATARTERVITASGGVTVASDDYVITMNKTVAATTTVTLPASPATSRSLIIKDGKGDAASFNITIDGNGKNIDGEATFVLAVDYEAVEIIYNGTQWNVIGSTRESDDVVGPGSSTDNAVTRFSGITGRLIKDSGVIIDNSNNITGVASLGTTGSRLVKGWFTDLEVTNTIAGSITGNAATVSTANEATDTTCFPLFITASGTQSLQPKNNTGFTFNSNTGALGANSLILAGAFSGFTEIQIDGTPNTDDTANGPTTSTFNAGATIAQWDLVYMGSGGKWLLADADSSTTSIGMLALAAAAGTDNNAMKAVLPGGFARNDSWNWTVGVNLYVSATAGGIVETAPSSTGQIVRVVGYAVTADVIYFMPSGAWVVQS